MTQETERRDYFRINDIIGLSYTVLKSGEEFLPASPDGLSKKLADSLAEVDAKFNQIENALLQENPTVAQALGLLNRKITSIAAHDAQQSGHPIKSYDEIEANISGSGMGFHCVEPLATETRLRVSVILKPSNIDLEFTATVVSCDPVPASPAGAYWMRIKIDEEYHAASEQLVQHVVQKQRVSIDKSR